MLGVQAWGDLNLGQRPQSNRHHQVIGLVVGAADLDADAVLVLHDCRDRRAGLDGLQLLDECLGQHRAAAWQARGTQVAITDAAVDAVLLSEVEQRQARWLVVAGTDLLVDQLPCGGRQLQLVEPGGDVDLVQGEQGAVRLRVERVIDRTGQVVEGLFVALEGLGGSRLLGGQVGGAEVLAVDQVAGGTDELRSGQCFKLETVKVLVEHRLGLGVTDPFAGGQARTATHA